MQKIVAVAVITQLSVIYAVSYEICPYTSPSSKCDHCCELGWLACTCPNTGLITGYAVPCCRQGDTCPPCIDYPGCSIYDNCKSCYTKKVLSHETFREGGICSSCHRGWHGRDCRECGGLRRGKRGIIDIENYPDDIECTWTIDVSWNSFVSVKFERFSLEFDELCSYDFVTIYDGPYYPEAKVKSYCGSTLPPKFVSKGHVLALHFKSDRTATFGGFRITYRELNACARQRCQNGGACMLTTNVDYTCICEPGFRGDQCELAVRCRLPTLSPYLTYTFDDKGLNYGAKMKYRCEREFSASGAMMASCQANGKWSARPPLCIPTCPRRSLIENGHIDGGLFTINSKITYSCKLGYILIGERSIICKENRQWSHPKPKCVISCRSLRKIPYGMLHFLYPTGYGPVSSNETDGKRVPAKTEVTYSCISGIRSKKLRRVCGNDGHWTGSSPQCIVGCDDPGLPYFSKRHIIYSGENTNHTEVSLGAILRNGRFKVGTLLQFQCINKDFILEGKFQRKCMPDGKWNTRRNPSCKPRCGIIPDDHTEINHSMYPWRVVVQGYIESGWQTLGEGAYIGNNLVVTIAQVVAFSSTSLNSNPLRVRMGKHLRSANKVVEVVVHKEFNPIHHSSDVALLALASRVYLSHTNKIWPICISGDTRNYAPRSPMIEIGDSGYMKMSTKSFVKIDATGSREFRISSNTSTTNQETEGFDDTQYSETVIPVRRVLHSHCENVFGTKMPRKGVICGLQFLEDDQSLTLRNCSIRSGAALVVRQGVLKTSNISIVNKTGLEFPSENFTNQWVLEGLSITPLNGPCSQFSEQEYSIFAKIRAHKNWINFIKRQLQEKGILV